LARAGWSGEKPAREAGEILLPPPDTTATLPDAADLEQALIAARILGHAQGFRILAQASDHYDWSLDLARIAEIWRAGCIIRSALLGNLSDALRNELPHGQLILVPAIRAQLTASSSPPPPPAFRCRSSRPPSRGLIACAPAAVAPISSKANAISLVPTALPDWIKTAQNTTAHGVKNPPNPC
jgi:hypothetical protein